MKDYMIINWKKKKKRRKKENENEKCNEGGNGWNFPKNTRTQG